MRYGAVIQRHWDRRAAVNFVCGGTGGGLLVVASVSGRTAQARELVLIGLGLIAVGLTAVWFKIGRPRRAMNVLLRPQTSWMTREAYVAALAVLMGALAMVTPTRLLLIASGVAGLGFTFCQGRILRAAAGIPAWREPVVVWLILVTALVEATSVVCLGVGSSDVPVAGGILLLLVVMRWGTWRRYRTGVAAGSASPVVLRDIDALGRGVLWLGHVLPVALISAAFVVGSSTMLVAAAALAALGIGWYMKWTLVTRLSRFEGYGMGRLRRGHPLTSPSDGSNNPE